MTYKKQVAALAMSLLLYPVTCGATLYWSDSFESGDFSRWSYVQGQDPAQGGPGPQYVYVTNYVAAGIPKEDGTYFGHFERPAGATLTPNAKVYKEWTVDKKKDQFGRIEDQMFDGGLTTAIYSAWYYFPKSYKANTNWVNIFQFKEEGYPTSTSTLPVQNPSWWINVGPESSFANGNTAMENSTPVLFVNNWGNNYRNFHPNIVPVPLGKWFIIAAAVLQGHFIHWYIDGVQFDTSLNSTYPVGRFYYNSQDWIFGVGHYGGYGAIYIDNVIVSSFP